MNYEKYEHVTGLLGENVQNIDLIYTSLECANLFWAAYKSQEEGVVAPAQEKDFLTVLRDSLANPLHGNNSTRANTAINKIRMGNLHTNRQNLEQVIDELCDEELYGSAGRELSQLFSGELQVIARMKGSEREEQSRWNSLANFINDLLLPSRRKVLHETTPPPIIEPPPLPNCD